MSCVAASLDDLQQPDHCINGCSSYPVAGRARKVLPGALLGFAQAQLLGQRAALDAARSHQRPHQRKACRGAGPLAGWTPADARSLAYALYQNTGAPRVFRTRERQLAVERQRSSGPREGAAAADTRVPNILDLPPNVLLTIACFLDHEAAATLSRVSRRLAEMVSVALELHFAFLTPARHAAHPASPPPPRRLGPAPHPGLSALQLRLLELGTPVNTPSGRASQPQPLPFRCSSTTAPGVSTPRRECDAPRTTARSKRQRPQGLEAQSGPVAGSPAQRPRRGSLGRTQGARCSLFQEGQAGCGGLRPARARANAAA